MAFIVVMIIFIYIIGFILNWRSLEDIGKNKKILIILIGLIIMSILTQILIAFSKNGIKYRAHAAYYARQ